MFESDRDPRNGSLYADINEFRERVRRLAPPRVNDDDQTPEGGDGNAEDRADRSPSPNRKADEVSALDDQLPAAAKKGAIEESGEFNT